MYVCITYEGWGVNHGNYEYILDRLFGLVVDVSDY